MRKSQGYDNCAELLAQALPHKYAKNIQVGLETRFGSLRSPRRAIRTLNDFMEFVVEQGLVIESCEELSLLFHAYQEVVLIDHQHLATSTIESNLLALNQTIRCLQDLRVFPNGHLAPVMRQADQTTFQSPSEDTKKVLGGLELPTQHKDDGTPLTLKLNVAADEFLSSLVNNIRKHRNTVLHISRSYIVEANSRLDYKEAAVSFVPPSLFDNPEHLTQCASSKGQRFSIFNKQRLGEIGKINLVAYFHHKRNGLVFDDFKGSFYLSSFGGTGELREHFGLSTLSAVAAQNIIVIESGINVSSLRDLEVSPCGGLKDSFKLTSDGFNIIYDKPRAGAPRNKEMTFIDDSFININYAFNYILRATRHYRSLAPPEHKRYLFLHDTMQEQGMICRISDMPFKDGFKKLLVKAKNKLIEDPSWCKHVSVSDIDDLLSHNPNAKQVRVSEGILRWYDSGGDPFVAANYLGNSEAVALNNYIPKELQGVLYSHQISKFQHLLLAAATDKKSYQKQVLQLESGDDSNESHDLYISQLDALNPNWRDLTERDKVDQPDKGNDAFALIMSKENVNKLYTAYEMENQQLRNGVPPNSEISLLSDLFKNLVSYINAYGKREQRKLLRDTITSSGAT
ncbi:hypothetical protein [Vibrio parahaemolyticus]|uniref:hypothetical protein n=1 Tax=Vibrio parahaemolyticus TaxID=670 RepID=UPI00046F50F1|nr:hypothetical protein [Vibrio parahaemolyticus]